MNELSRFPGERVEVQEAATEPGLVERLNNLRGTQNKGSGPLVTEDSAAQNYRDLYGDKLRFCHDAGVWYQYNGAIWRQNRTGLAFQWARQLARELVESQPDRIKYINSKTSFAAGVERFARCDPAFAVTADYWNRDAYLIGTPSGPVDLKTGQIVQATPDDGISKSTAVAPALIADCPLWLRFLHETTGGDSELMHFLQQFSGYALTGDVREHVLVFGYGAGGNGKSVFVNTVASILGDYAVTSPMETFAVSTFDKHPTEVAMLAGARLVTSSETEEGRAWAESRIKALTGGDTITARFMRKDFFSFKPSFKLLIIGNHRPQLRNVDDAARRRFVILPFVHKPERPDPELEVKLRNEWPGILRWMIEGCLDWQANGLIRPKSVTEATAEYFGAQDIVGQWLDEECECEHGNEWKKATSGELYAAFSAYAKAAGEVPGSQKALSETLQRRGFVKTKGAKGARIFEGVRLIQRDLSG